MRYASTCDAGAAVKRALTVAAVAAAVVAVALAGCSGEPGPSAGPTWDLGDRPVIVMDTSLGTVKIELWHDRTPITTENFVNCAKEGHYNGTIFHRVIPEFMVQGGGFDVKMNSRPPGKSIRNEASAERRNLRGTIAMARTSDPHSATGQFFINLKDNDFLDRDHAEDGWGYAVFGKVVEGMDVVDRIAARPTHKVGPHEAVPVEPVLITSVRVEDRAE